MKYLPKPQTIKTVQPIQNVQQSVEPAKPETPKYTLPSSVMLDQFREEFAPKLEHPNGEFGGIRWEGFQFIIAQLASLDRPGLIVETGTARYKGNWYGDGQSTLLWEWMSKEFEFESWSVDIQQTYIQNVQEQTSLVHLVCSDSIQFLSTFYKPEKIDLLYLDSRDWGPGLENEAYSELHHAGELATIYENLQSGCLIAVDDCHSETKGKHVMVDAFFKRLGIAPILRTYITVWRKP